MASRKANLNVEEIDKRVAIQINLTRIFQKHPKVNHLKNYTQWESKILNLLNFLRIFKRDMFLGEI
jgi:hypothetical protein